MYIYIYIHTHTHNTTYTYTSYAYTENTHISDDTWLPWWWKLPLVIKDGKAHGQGRLLGRVYGLRSMIHMYWVTTMIWQYGPKVVVPLLPCFSPLNFDQTCQKPFHLLKLCWSKAWEINPWSGRAASMNLASAPDIEITPERSRLLVISQRSWGHQTRFPCTLNPPDHPRSKIIKNHVTTSPRSSRCFQHLPTTFSWTRIQTSLQQILDHWKIQRSCSFHQWSVQIAHGVNTVRSGQMRCCWNPKGCGVAAESWNLVFKIVVPPWFPYFFWWPI